MLLYYLLGISGHELKSAWRNRGLHGRKWFFVPQNTIFIIFLFYCPCLLNYIINSYFISFILFYFLFRFISLPRFSLLLLFHIYVYVYVDVCLGMHLYVRVCISFISSFSFFLSFRFPSFFLSLLS